MKKLIILLSLLSNICLAQLTAGRVVTVQSQNALSDIPNGANGTYLGIAGGVLAYSAPPTGSPAGSNTQIQYNNSGAFGASANITMAVTDALPQINVGVNSTGTSTLYLGSNSNINTVAQMVCHGINASTQQEVRIISNDASAIAPATAGDNTITSINKPLAIQSPGLYLNMSSGFIVLSGLPTTCSGAPTGALAIIAGVLTICP